MGNIRHTAIIEAIQKACQAFGMKKIAAELDKQPSTLYGELNPWAEPGKAKLGLDDAIEIIRVTQDFEPLILLARELGFSIEKVEVTPDMPTVAEELCQDMTALGKWAEVCRKPDATETEIRLAGDFARKEIFETETLMIKQLKERKG